MNSTFAAKPGSVTAKDRGQRQGASKTAEDASAQFVVAAYEAQLKGDVAQRDDWLAKALAADPDCRLAHWLRGEVRFNGEWRSLEAIRETIDNNPAYPEYAAMRAELTGSPTEHEELAHWCFEQGLENEERYHWAHVLQAEPDHQFARGRLGVRPYRGGLYTNQQIEDAEREQASAEAIFVKMKPRFVALCRQALREEGTIRQDAFAALANVADVRQIPALEYAVAHEAKTTSDAQRIELYLAVLDSLSKSDDPQATHRLLDYAVYAVPPEVRQRAAQHLKPRPVTDYVPQLMGALTAPVETEVLGFTGVDGTVFVDQYYRQSGPLADYQGKRSTVKTIVQVGGTRAPNGGDGPNTARQRQLMKTNSAANIHAIRRQAAMANAQTNSQINSRNLRVREVLANIFEGDLGPDPKAYWQAWTEYNELYAPPRETISLADEVNYQYTPTMSCFSAGTPIWTQAGPRPIEQIVVGDMVLSQNPATGELAFQPVMETTIRPPSKMVRIEAGGQPIDSTLGHRFWVNGKGWEMAKFLAPDAAVQSAAGSASISSVEPLPQDEQAEAYNLVVHDFHTYFVGDAKLLVHDNSCPKPTASKIPGQATLRDVQLAVDVSRQETAAAKSPSN